MKKKAACTASATVVAGTVVAGVFVWSYRERTYPNSFSDGPVKTNAPLAEALADHGLQLPSDAVGTRYMAVTNLDSEYPLQLFFVDSCAATQAVVRKMGIPGMADQSAMPDADVSTFAMTEG